MTRIEALLGFLGGLGLVGSHSDTLQLVSLFTAFCRRPA